MAIMCKGECDKELGITDKNASYQTGYKRCMVCRVAYKTTENRCYCCHTLLRSHSRSNKHKYDTNHNNK